MDQLTGFRQVTALRTLNHIFRSYGAIKEIDHEENAVNMWGQYDLTELIACHNNQLVGKVGTATKLKDLPQYPI